MTTNPSTTVSVLFSWTIFFLAYNYLHGQVSKWDELLVAIAIAFAWLIPMSIISFLINFPFDKQFDKFTTIAQPLFDYINNIFNIPIFKFASEASKHIFLMSLTTALHGGLSCIICLYLDKDFKNFIYIFLFISAFKLCENILLTIMMMISKIK